MEYGRHRPSILLVDDHELTLDLLARLLRSDGHEVHTALGCREALRVVLQYGCDLLVSDLLLPDGNGCDLLRAVRARRPVPAIAITGQDDDDAIRSALSAGFQRVLVKPLSYKALSAAVLELR
jgi:CheY-like chemotaxis protein